MKRILKNKWKMKSIEFLTLILFITSMTGAQEIPYGNNPDAGNYFDAGGVKLYYEIYGDGQPILMLHGGVFGYIDELSGLIDKLSVNYKVICLATRGHGKSYIGNETFTYRQRAEDAYKLLQHLKIDSSIVLGFSDGATSALKMASIYPNTVKKVIAMGVGDSPKGDSLNEYYTSENLLANYNEHFTKLLSIMPEPERWNISLEYANHLYNEDYVSIETFSKIKCPVLLMNGENDVFFTIDDLVKCYKSIPNARLAIIPECHHVVFWCDFQAVWLNIEKFLK